MKDYVTQQRRESMTEDPGSRPSTEIQWRRLIVDGSVIVVSILLALAADAWWDGVKDAEAESRLLDSVRQDLAESQEDLEPTVRITAEQLDRFNAFVEALPIPPMPCSRSLLGAKTYQPYAGALRVADLSLLRDDDFRSQLGRWLGYSEDLLENTPLLHDARLKSGHRIVSAPLGRLRSGRRSPEHVT